MDCPKPHINILNNYTHHFNYVRDTNGGTARSFLLEHGGGRGRLGSKGNNMYIQYATKMSTPHAKI